MRVRLHLRRLRRRLARGCAEESRERVEVAAAYRHDAQGDDGCDCADREGASRHELAPKQKDGAERDECGREPEHGRDGSGDDHAEHAAQRRDRRRNARTPNARPTTLAGSSPQQDEPRFIRLGLDRSAYKRAQ